MQRRSWMAALTLAALAGAFTGPSNGAEEPAPIKQKVHLKLHPAGFKRPGEVVIRPGSPGCRFKPITQPVKANDVLPIEPFDVEVFSADRDCAFLITLKEPGQPDKTLRRHVRIAPPVPGRTVAQVFDCYVSTDALSTPSAIAGKAADAAKAKK